MRSRLDEATLTEKQRILQLLIDRVIVGEDALEIRHVIPLGRLKAEPADLCPTDPTGSGGGEGERAGWIAAEWPRCAIAFGRCAPSERNRYAADNHCHPVQVLDPPLHPPSHESHPGLTCDRPAIVTSRGGHTNAPEPRQTRPPGGSSIPLSSPVVTAPGGSRRPSRSCSGRYRHTHLNNSLQDGVRTMRAAIYARVSTGRQGRDQTIDSQLTPSVTGPPLKVTNSKTITFSPTRATPVRGSTAPPSTASATPPARASSKSSPSTAPTASPAVMPTRSSCWRSSQGRVRGRVHPAAVSDDPHDQLLLQIQGAIAEYERAVLAERFRRGKLQKARAGHWVGGQGSYGYRYVPRRDGVPGHLEINEDEAAVVRMLYRWLIDERMTVRQIIKRLAAGPWRPRNGKRLWSNAVVHRILSDPLYAGTAYANRYAHVAPRKPRSAGPRAGTPTCRKPRPREEWIPVPVPAIIDVSTYQYASEQLARNSALSFRNNTRNDYLLRCLLTCRTCGLAMCGVTSSGAGGRRQHRYYICHGKDTLARDRSHPCPQPRTRVEELDATVWDHVRRLLDDPATLAAQFEEQARQADAPTPARTRRARSARPCCADSTARSRG